MYERDLPPEDENCPVCERWSGTPGAMLIHLDEAHGADWAEEHPRAAKRVREIFAALRPKRGRR